ncbi:MAG: sulfatase [Planctomycetota bacterium]|jgi:arylsulfatase A-like enzyme
MMLRTALTLALAATALVAAERPNVLFIAVDDLKPVLGCFGDELAQTPHIDALAASGVAFTNAHTPHAICGPSRAAIMSGMRSDQVGVIDLKTMWRDVTPDVVALPQLFREHGYTTAAIGKIYDPRCVDKDNDKPSWSLPYKTTGKLSYDPEWGEPALGYYVGAEIKAAIAKLPKKTARDDAQKQGLKPGYERVDGAPDLAYHDGAAAARGIELLEQLAADEAPFFLAVGFKRPHLPFVAPGRCWDRFDPAAFDLGFQGEGEGFGKYFTKPGSELRGGYSVPFDDEPLPEAYQRELIHGYYATVSFVDDQIGKLLAKVDELQLREDTIIVLWSDHGFHLGDHRQWGKHTALEQATRSPLIFSVPGRAARGATATPAQLLDIYPTLCELAGLPAPAVLVGSSLVPVLDDITTQVHEAALSIYPFSGGKVIAFSVRDGRYRYTEWRQWKTKQRDGDYTIIGRAFFDYELDPEETKNHIDDPAYASEIERLKALAHAHQ